MTFELIPLKGTNDTLYKFSEMSRGQRRPILIGHGFNAKFQKMKELGVLLSSLNYFPYFFVLDGHQSQNWQSLTSERWINQISDTCQYLIKIHDAEIDFLGFSLSSLVIEVYLQKYPSVNSKRIHISPAFKIKALLESLIFMNEKLPLFKSVRSFNYKEYRVFDRLPFKLYQVLLQMTEALSVEAIKNSLVFINRTDELIPTTYLQKTLSRNNLVHFVKNKEAELSKFGHLIIDSKTVPQKEWERVKKEIKTYCTT